MKLTRRAFTAGAAAGFAAATLKSLPAQAGIKFGEPVAFSHDAVINWAQLTARLPYAPYVPRYTEVVNRIDFNTYQEIRFRPNEALWADGSAPFPVELFHVSKYFQEPVRIFVVKDGLSREILYTPDLFSYGRAEFARSLPPDVGFVGFRVMYAPGEPDWLSFLGASYFRSCGETRQYGLSARGVAIDTAMPWPEEFPRFTNFWLEPSISPPGIVVYALMDSPSLTGAYKITAIKGKGVVTEVQAKLFARKDIQRLGIAPLTSMYWYGKTNRRQSADWRPEVHDSDGLAIWTGSGERIWRPLNNPFGVQTSSFFDKNPRGFGLSQRERRFAAYEDDSLFYEKRPTAWIETLGEWGEGAVQLVEIPTRDETNDNIVAYWTPKEPLKAGGVHDMHYRIFWQHDEPYPGNMGRVVSTRVGVGGVAKGLYTEVVDSFAKYVVDFEGGELGQFETKDNLQVNVTAPKGVIERKAAFRIVDTGKWRAMFDFRPADREPVDLRMYLEKDGKALTETWLYQHLPG